MKVRAYLALTATAVLIPVVIFSAGVLSMLLEAERTAALDGVGETARATALAVDRELTGAEATLRVLATSSYLTDGNLRAFYEQAKTATEKQDSWIVLFDRDGQQVINTSVPFGTPLPRRRHPERGLEIMRTKKLDVSNLIYGPVTKSLLISVEAPVPLGDGQRYVIAQSFRAERFQKSLAQRGIAGHWVAGIFDRNGMVIARTHRAEEFRGKPGAEGLIEASRGATEGVRRTHSLEGIDVYAVYTRSAMSGWLIGIGVPATDVETSARRAVGLAGIGLLAALACALIAAALLGRRLARSIAVAARSADALGRGEQPGLAGSGVEEVDALQRALARAGRLLQRERDSRAQAEHERARLFASEQEARRIAESQNKAKDEFLAMLGHELRNPLGAIVNSVALLENPGVSETGAQRARDVVARQSRHLARLVDDLLDLSRAMAGKVQLNRQRIDLGQAVLNCVGALDGNAARNMIRVHADTVWIDGDPTRIEQIVSNLLVNACKYTPEDGEVEVCVSAEDGKAVLTVRDSGIGISDHLLPRIFDVFVQGPAQLDRAMGGLGIGLSLVRRLVVLHGGSVLAESPGDGKGSTFTVRLPLAESRPDAVAAAPDRSPAAAGCKVLLIEDNDDNRQTLALLLTLHGHEVAQAGDGAQGLKLAQEFQPQVAVVDIGLPKMDGYEIARRLRATAATRHVRLIAVTGYGQADDRQRALDAGFDLHFVKPVEASKLLDAVHVLGRRDTSA